MNGKTNANGSGGVSTGISVPLEPPTNLALSAEDSKISLTWTDPNDKVTETYNELVSQWSYDSLVRKQGSAPTSITDGTLVAKITGKNQYQNIPYVDTGMENDKEWFYSVFAHNQFNTPSDPIYGSDIPTATVVTEYQQMLQLNRQGTPSTDGIGNWMVGLATNGTHIIAPINYEPDGVVFTFVDQSFVRSEIQYHSDEMLYSMAGLKGNGIRIGTSALFAYATRSAQTVYIDQNLTSHTIESPTMAPGTYVATSVDDSVGYIHYMSGQDRQYGYRIDDNFIYTTISSPNNYFGSRLNGKKYGIITNDDNGALSYNIDGIRTVLRFSNLDTFSTINTSICNDFKIFITAGCTVGYAVSDNLVVTQLNDLPIESLYGHNPVPNIPMITNIQSIGIAIFPIGYTAATTVMGEYSTYECDLIIDKNLTCSSESKILPIQDDTISTGNYMYIGTVRFDKWLCMSINIFMGHDYGYCSLNNLYVIKNGYESDIEGG